MTMREIQLTNLYKTMGIDMELLPDGKVKVEQVTDTNGILLNQYDLRQRGKQVFPNRHIVPKVFFLDTDVVTPVWIKSKMDEVGIYQRDLSRQIGMDETVVSKLINGKRPMTRAVQALFYYYFTLYEVTKDTRQEE
ncbi:helix-turn-helix transcriptional regulator [Porphyromonas somerae]|uniref:helix-turn-helix transcriptional regulator n=1 Tax=Porphyromonas somerae TaxID=322095 RepID=UPI002A810169|nr:helix-turn-helix transcriptional regulator [Porphyromonas somerae]